jgi:hypothetical protein
VSSRHFGKNALTSNNANDAGSWSLPIPAVLFAVVSVVALSTWKTHTMSLAKDAKILASPLTIYLLQNGPAHISFATTVEVTIPLTLLLVVPVTRRSASLAPR